LEYIAIHLHSVEQIIALKLEAQFGGIV